MVKYIRDDNKYLVTLTRGEKIIEELLEFCELNRINSATLTGIGGARDIELGYYDLETKEYSWKTFPKVHEVLSLNGNICMVDDKPFIHAHMVISNNTFQCFGGHLKEAVVGATLEVLIVKLDKGLTRVFDDNTGLKLLDLPED